ncbi:hypothetical protein H311_00041, partial [Anncaliia algerae PRA109]
MHEEEVKKWIDAYSCIVLSYNQTWSRAINKTPMLAFRDRNGKNNELNKEKFDDKYEDLIYNTDLSTIFEYIDDESAEGLSSLNVETLHNESTSIFSAPTVSKKYTDKYIRRRQQDADIHFHNIRFNPGDKVLLKKDFD